MKWDMEIMPPGPFVSSSSNSSWMFEDTRNTKWTPEENKAFENALAKYDKDTPDRWHRVAEMVPGKTVSDVIRQYKELEDDVSSIEAGLFPFAGYSSPTSTFTLDWGGSQLGFDGFKQFSGASTSKKSPNGRPSEQERKKGVPWTEEEHKLFLMGLKKYGKGDWRNISRNFVVSRTPTQVASHAQKYFIRQLSELKDKRRASIHDITTVNLSEDHQIPSPDSAKNDQSPSSSNKMAFNPWNHQTNGSNGSSSSSPVMSFNMDHGNFFAAQGQNHHGVNVMHNNHHHGSYLGCQGLAFQMQPAHHYPHA